MVWNNLAILGAGLGVGMLSGWIMGRSQPQSNLSTSSSTTSPSTTSPSTTSTVAPSFNPEKPDRETEVLKSQLQQAQLAYQMAKEMAQFKAGFLARTSHELRSPINSVLSLHQLILSDLCDSPDEEREFVAQAYAAAQRMLALLDKLIGVAKTTHGTEQLQIQPVSLEDVLMEVQSLTYLQAQNRGIQLEIEFPDSDFYVLADPKWLRQVLINLVDTPISLMQEGSVRLTSQLDTAAEVVRIWIEDQRPAKFWSEPIDGLYSFGPTEQVEPLSMLKKAEVLAEAGGRSPSPGLSLLINQTLIELMGGRLEVLATPSAETPLAEKEANLTRIQCMIPLVLEEEEKSELAV
jgi:signal transduction histidine kinase